MVTKKKSKKTTKKKVTKKTKTTKKKQVKKKTAKKRTTKKKVKRIKTGIKGFDKIIGEGFETNSVNMIVGDSGSGKSIFSMELLLDGLEKGETCLYVTFEEKKEEFFRNMKKFGWDLEKYEKDGKLFFLEYNPEKVKTMIEEGGGEIERLVLKHKIKRMVIDSMTSFELLFEDEFQKREAALSLFDIIRKWDCTTFLTLQENPKERNETSSLEFESDSIILIYFVRRKIRRKRFIEVLKMRGTKHSDQIHELKITKNGFEVTKKTLNRPI